MKTKHFLITTEDGSAVAVISSKTTLEFESKLGVCLREQFDSPNLSLDPTCNKFIEFLGKETKVPYIYDKEFRENEVVFIQRIEIY